MKSAYLFTLAILLSVGVSGCDEPRKTPPNVSVAFVHAAPTQGEIRFRREEALEAQLTYSGSSTRSFNVDTYNFHFELSPAGEDPTRPVSFVYEMVSGTEYHIVAAELGGQFQQIVLEFPALTSDAPNAQLGAQHLANSLGAIDVFFVPPGTDPATTAPLGTLALGQNFAPQSITPGDYEFIVTEAGNPTAILLRSGTSPIGSSVSALFTIMDGGSGGFAPLTVAVSGNSSFSFVDRDLQSSLRVVNGISDQSSLDIGIDGNLMPPLIPAVPFGTASAYDLVAPGNRTLTSSPAGNPSVIVTNSPFEAEAGRFGTAFIANSPGAATMLYSIDDYQPIPGEAKMALYNAATLFQFVDIYITPPGTDLNTVPPIAGLTTGGFVPNFPFTAEMHEVTIRQGGTETILAGPTPITLLEGGFYGILLADGPGGATVDLILLDDFN